MIANNQLLMWGLVALAIWWFMQSGKSEFYDPTINTNDGYYDANGQQQQQQQTVPEEIYMANLPPASEVPQHADAILMM